MDKLSASGAAPGPPNSATLYIMLSRPLGSSVAYNAQTRDLSVRCTADGYVWNTESSFQWKRCSVTFYRGTLDRLKAFAREHGLEEVSGGIEVAAGLEPETIEDEGETIAFSPINIYLSLDHTTYAHTEELLRSCLSSDGQASLSLQFAHREFARTVMTLDDIDVAVKNAYPIIGFHVSRTRQSNKKVNVPKYKYDAAAAATLTFTARNAEIETSVWHSDFSVNGLNLTGTMRSQQLNVNSDDDTFEIKEFECTTGSQQGYPEEAFPGVVWLSKNDTHTNCCVTLYATRDALAHLGTLLSGMSKGDTVKFNVSMIAEGLPVAIGEQKYFSVTSFTPVLLKSYS